MIEVKKKKKIKGAKTVVEYGKLDRKVAALWTRVSTREQEENNCSLENQRKICLEYAEQRGITIKKEFGGTHESAKSEGELYRKMISEVAKDKEINIILVYSFDRFSSAGTEAYLKSKGIYVISATQATDPDSAAGVPKWNFTEQGKWQLSNNFVKPNEQSQIYLNFVVARN